MVCLSGSDLLRDAPSALASEGDSLVFKPLTLADQPACCAVEEAFVNPEHRASPEKFDYRLSKASHISYGLFLRPEQNPRPGSLLSKIEPDRLRAITTGDEGDKLILIAQLVSTMGSGPVVNDTDMDYPKNWRDTEATKDSPLGHQENGRTVCVHSLAVIPEVQGYGVGRFAMKAYLRVMRESGLADRVALLCQDYLVSFYEKCGFKSLGESKAQFGGGGWYDMISPFSDAA